MSCNGLASQKHCFCRQADGFLVTTAVGAAAHHLEPLPRCLRTLSAPGAALQHLRHVPTSRLIDRIKLPFDAVYARFASNRRPVIHQGRGAAVVLSALAPSPASKRCAVHPPAALICHRSPLLLCAVGRCASQRCLRPRASRTGAQRARQARTRRRGRQRDRLHALALGDGRSCRSRLTKPPAAPQSLQLVPVHAALVEAVVMQARAPVQAATVRIAPSRRRRRLRQQCRTRQRHPAPETSRRTASEAEAMLHHELMACLMAWTLIPPVRLPRATEPREAV